MKVRLEDIPPEGLPVAFELRGQDPAELGPAVAGVVRAPRASLRLFRQGDEVLAHGEFGAVVRLVCSRCLAEADHEVGGSADWLFLPAAPGGEAGRGAAANEEVRLAREDLEAIFYQDEVLDLGRALVDEIALALPMAPLCREDCPGLCPVCGKPRAAGGCDCPPAGSDPRWAKLARLKLE